MEQNSVQIGDSSANLKISVAVESGILSVSSRFEFMASEGKEGGFGMSSFVEQMSLLTESHFEKQSMLTIKSVERFLSTMNYQKSETEHQTSRFLYDEYLDFCKEYDFIPISRREFFKGLESLGFVVRPRMINNQTFVYCKKGEVTL